MTDSATVFIWGSSLAASTTSTAGTPHPSEHVLRCALSHHTGCPASELAIARSALGKPYLLSSGSTRLSLAFNCSHVESYVVCAVTNQNVIGVDIEYNDPPKDFLAIAIRFFALQELDYLQYVSVEPGTDFIRMWTRKEAVLKATGMGFSLGLSSFSVIELDGRQFVKQLTLPCGATFWLREFWIEPNLIGALATVNFVSTVTVKEYLGVWGELPSRNAPQTPGSALSMTSRM